MHTNANKNKILPISEPYAGIIFIDIVTVKIHPPGFIYGIEKLVQMPKKRFFNPGLRPATDTLKKVISQKF